MANLARLARSLAGLTAVVGQLEQLRVRLIVAVTCQEGRYVEAGGTIDTISAATSRTAVRRGSPRIPS